MIKLLLVEDDANLRYIVQSGLQELIGGYEVIVAANAAEGLDAKYATLRNDDTGEIYKC